MSPAPSHVHLWALLHPYPPHALQNHLGVLLLAMEMVNKRVLNSRRSSFSHSCQASNCKRKLPNFSSYPKSLPSVAELQVKEFIRHFTDTSKSIFPYKLSSVLTSGVVFLPVPQTDSLRADYTLFFPSPLSNVQFLSILSLIESIGKYLWSASSVPEIFIGSWDISASCMGKDFCPPKVYIWVSED